MHFYCTTSWEPPSKAQTDARACRIHLGSELQELLGSVKYWNRAQPESIFLIWMRRENLYGCLFLFFMFLLQIWNQPNCKHCHAELVWTAVMIYEPVFLSCLTWGSTPALLPAPVGRHRGVPTWTFEVRFNKDNSYERCTQRYAYQAWPWYTFAGIYFVSLNVLLWQTPLTS